MKRLIIIAIFLPVFSLMAPAQNETNIGIAYFGHFVTHPGVMLELERENFYTKNASLSLRTDLGYYNHPRNHAALFCDVNYGFRRYYDSGLFIEESIGIGVLQTIINSDGVYSFDEKGEIRESTRLNPPDLMPSLSIGMGYRLIGGSGKSSLIWIRPKLFLQYPHKLTSTYHFSLQFGYSYTLDR